MYIVYVIKGLAFESALSHCIYVSWRNFWKSLDVHVQSTVIAHALNIASLFTLIIRTITHATIYVELFAH